VIVRPTRLLHPHGFEMDHHPDIHVGDEYLVAGIALTQDARGLRIFTGAVNAQVGIWPVEMFEVVSAHIPSSWRVAIEHTADYVFMQIDPEPWLRPGFWDDLWAEGFNEANLSFQDEIDRMLVEEGRAAFYG
jgi:hypothetical protein